MKKLYFLLGSLLLSLTTGFAQEYHLRNSKWFSYDTQLQFQPNSTPQATSNPFSGFVTASVCDQNGNPLIVVNEFGTVWANGQNIGIISYNQYNVTIIPKPKHSNRYYIVTSDTYELNYWEVDLATSTLTHATTQFNDINGNPILSSPGGSGVTSTVHANGIDYWITAFVNDNLMSYLITENGINLTPSGVFELPPSDSYATLTIKMSPKTSNNTKHIAIVNYSAGISLKDFNDVTGEITNSSSNMNYALQQREIQKWNDGILTKDAEFSADGNILYCVDDFATNYGSVYAIQEYGNTLPIGEYGGFIVSRRGPNDNVYFLDGYGQLSQEQPNSTNYPSNTGISLFNDYGFRQWGYLPPLVSFNDCLASPEMIPTFSPAYICKGATSYSLPTTSNNGITGSWSSPFNNMATTTYTFTSDQGQCAAETTNLTVRVNDQNTVPTFDNYPIYVPTSVCVGSSYTFPTTSTNQITGTWSPAFNNTATTTYTFTPSVAQCGATITHTITIDQRVTPTFNPIAPICYGTPFTRSLSSTNGISGSWSPERNFTETTTYTFTPFDGECGTTTTMTVIVKPSIPIFNDVSMIDSTVNYTLPITSTNGILGTWSPPVIIEGDNTYTFTPNTDQCANSVTKSFLLLKQTAIDAVDDEFYVAAATSAFTPPVFNNDVVSFGDSAYGNSSLSFVSLEGINGSILPPDTDFLTMTGYHYYDMLMPDGTYFMPSCCFSNGTYRLTYEITSNECSGKSDIATAIIHYDYETPNYGRKAETVQEQTDNINVYSNTKIYAYPNPSNGIFNIDLSTVEGDYDTVRVYNMLGAMVYQSNLKSKSSNEINLTEMTTGFYIAKVSGNSGGTSFQLIKQ